MLNQDLKQIIKHWEYIAPYVHYPKNKRDFDNLVNTLDQLLNMVGNDETHQLMSLIDIISHIIESYESKRAAKNKRPSGVDVLIYLMESHNLNQSDLPEIGSQGVISEIIRGKRKLNLRQIKLLAKRFSVEPATFIDKD